MDAFKTQQCMLHHQALFNYGNLTGYFCDELAFHPEEVTTLIVLVMSVLEPRIIGYVRAMYNKSGEQLLEKSVIQLHGCQ